MATKGPVRLPALYSPLEQEIAILYAVWTMIDDMVNFENFVKFDPPVSTAMIQSSVHQRLFNILHGGLAHWSEDDIVEFLRTGRNEHTAAFSIMAEVIDFSTQHMVDDDLRAIATYLKDLDGQERKRPYEPDRAVMDAGAAIYFDNCSASHASDGSGVPRFVAPLAGSGKVNNEDATTVIRVILEGERAVPTKKAPSPLTMPAFAWKLTDEQIATVATYVRSSWGNRGGTVSASDVARLKERLAEGLGPDR